MRVLYAFFVWSTILIIHVYIRSCFSAINTCLRGRRMVDILLCNKTFERNNYNSQNSWWLWLILEGNIAYFNNITYIKRFSMWKAFPIFIFVKICLRCFLAIPVCPLPIFENNASDQWRKVLLLGSNSFELGLKLHNESEIAKTSQSTGYHSQSKPVSLLIIACF